MKNDLEYQNNPNMRTFEYFIITLLMTIGIQEQSYCQIKQHESPSIFRRQFNQAITYDVSRKYVFAELFEVRHNELVDVSLTTVTSAKSGELTTLVYHSDDLKTEGLVFTFWNDYITEASLKYDGYGFRAFELRTAHELLIRLDEILEEKKSKLDDDNNAVFRYEDLVFSFSGNRGILVFWGKYRAEWTTANLKTTIKRINKFLGKKNK